MKKKLMILITSTIFLLVSQLSFSLTMPDFTLTDQYGVEHTLSEYRGKVVFLNFWATWCPPCKGEMPDIEKLYGEYGNNAKDVVILGINNEEKDTVKTFLEKNNYTFPTVTAENKLLYQYSVRAFPTTFVIDKNGNLFKYSIGALSYNSMKELIEKAKLQ